MGIRTRLDRYAQGLFLDCVGATNFPDQEPGHVRVRWYHLLWWLVPIAGPIGFMLCGESSYAERRESMEKALRAERRPTP